MDLSASRFWLKELRLMLKQEKYGREDDCADSFLKEQEAENIIPVVQF